MTRPHVYVTQHALQQALRRFPELLEWERRSVIRLICFEVGRGWDEGRRAKTQPRWLSGERYKGRDGARYVWTENQRRAYVVRPAHGGDRLVVITTLRPAYTTEVLTV